MKFVKPKIFILAETRLSIDYTSFLNHLNVPGWTTDAPSDVEKLIEMAGKTCYLSFDKKLNKNLNKTRDNQNENYIQNGLIKQKHTSVLEHGCITFALCDVSRVFTHELIRHSVGCSYSQQSGRYVRVDEVLFTDQESLNNSSLKNDFEKVLNKVEDYFKDLEKQMFENIDESDFTIKKQITSLLRRILPEGSANTIIFTANHRALRHICELRTCEHAEEEIQLVFKEILKTLKTKFPNIYKDM